MNENAREIKIGKQYVENALATDFSDIAKYYFTRSESPSDHFWVVVDEHDRVFGTVGLLYSSDREGEVMRMYVDPTQHRKGLGSLLLNTLIDFARVEGYQRLFLTTLMSNRRAIAFYQQHGFDVPERYAKPDVDLELCKLGCDLSR